MSRWKEREKEIEHWRILPASRCSPRCRRRLLRRSEILDLGPVQQTIRPDATTERARREKPRLSSRLRRGEESLPERDPGSRRPERAADARPTRVSSLPPLPLSNATSIVLVRGFCAVAEYRLQSFQPDTVLRFGWYRETRKRRGGGSAGGDRGCWRRLYQCSPSGGRSFSLPPNRRAASIHVVCPPISPRHLPLWRTFSAQVAYQRGRTSR